MHRSTSSLLLFLPFALLPALSFASTSIESLLERGALALEIFSKGGHEGQCLRIHARNTSNAFFVTRLEPGRMLLAGDASQQDILLTEEVLIALSPAQEMERSIAGFCYQSSDTSPQEGTRFDLGQMADPFAVKTANYLNAHRDIPLGTQQAAVWMLSDCHPMSAIDRKTAESNALVNFMAELLHLPKPWYTTEHLNTVDRLYSPRVLRVYGDIPFELVDYTNMQVRIIDPTGKVVKHLIRDVPYGPGRYSIPMDLRVDHWAHGSYEVELRSDGNLIKAETFEL
jgi:hypothetical protein